MKLNVDGAESMSLGHTLRHLRLQRGLSLAQLAEMTGSHVGNLSRIERNLAKPSLDFLYKIAEALNFRLQDIFRLADAANEKSDSLAALNAIFMVLLDSDKELLLQFAQLLRMRQEKYNSTADSKDSTEPGGELSRILKQD